MACVRNISRVIFISETCLKRIKFLEVTQCFLPLQVPEVDAKGINKIPVLDALSFELAGTTKNNDMNITPKKRTRQSFALGFWDILLGSVQHCCECNRIPVERSGLVSGSQSIVSGISLILGE